MEIRERTLCFGNTNRYFKYRNGYLQISRLLVRKSGLYILEEELSDSADLIWTKVTYLIPVPIQKLVPKVFICDPNLFFLSMPGDEKRQFFFDP